MCQAAVWCYTGQLSYNLIVYKGGGYGNLRGYGGGVEIRGVFGWGYDVGV